MRPSKTLIVKPASTWRKIGRLALFRESFQNHKILEDETIRCHQQFGAR
jgi:hypothetical protein